MSGSGFTNDILHAENVDFSGGFPVAPKMTANGDLLIGSTVAPNIRVGNLASADGSVTITTGAGTIDLSVAGGGDVVGPASAVDNDIVVFDGITGKIIKDTGISSIAPTFSGNVTSLTQVIAPYDNKAGAAEGFFFSDGTNACRQVGTGLANYFFGNAGNSTMSSIANTGVGQAALVSLTAGLQNTAMGNGALLAVNSGQGNSGFGYLAGQGVTDGVYNTAIGLGSLSLSAGADYNNAFGALALQVATGSFNNAIGFSTLQNVTGNENTAIGHGAASALLSGINNIVIGSLTGSAYVGAESNNIVIGAQVTGVAGESNVIRIGNGSTKCILTGQLITSSGQVVKVTTPGAYPYTTLTTDYVILVDSSVARTIVPLAAPVTGVVYVIKDAAGTSGANPITVTPSGKNIDGAVSYVLSSNYGSITIVFGGTEWSIV